MSYRFCQKGRSKQQKLKRSHGRKTNFNFFDIHSTDEVIIQITFSEEKNGCPLYSLKLNRWRGPPHIYEVEQYETVYCNFNIRQFMTLGTVHVGDCHFYESNILERE